MNDTNILTLIKSVIHLLRIHADRMVPVSNQYKYILT